MITLEFESAIIKIGRNQSENNKLVLAAHPDDIWMHLLSESSPHLLLKCNKITPELLQHCAQLVKQYSKCRGMKRVKVMWCSRNKIRTTRIPGIVDVSKFKIITV